MLATAAERRRSSSSSSSSNSASVELDPLLKDLTEKKQIFRRSVLSLASELKDARVRLAQQEESFARETLTREAAETKAKSMEEHVSHLQMILEERDGQLQATTVSAQQYLKDLDNLSSQLSVTQAVADANAALALSAEAQCSSLLRELDEKNTSLRDHEDRVSKLGKQLDLLQRDLQARDLSQKQLKDEVRRIEKEIVFAVSDSSTKDCERRRILEDYSPKSFDNINEKLSAKDDEISRFRDEIIFLSSHWKQKTEELQSQLEKHHRTDQELKKRVLKMEFCLQEVRAQTRKLQRMGERTDNALKELKDQLSLQQQNGDSFGDGQSIWESSSFKIIASMSMLVMVVFARR